MDSAQVSSAATPVKVSVILPARGRQLLAAATVLAWRFQTWPNTELIIIDDADRPAFEIAPKGRVKYLLADRLTIGAKRNLACQLAAGEIIVHFDTDDWYAPERIADQVEALEASGKAVTMYRDILFTDGENWWRNTNWPGGYGSTLAYRRTWWEAHPFLELQSGEDWEFVAEAMRHSQVIARPARQMMFATIHPDNTSPRVIGPGWVPCLKPDW